MEWERNNHVVWVQRSFVSELHRFVSKQTDKAQDTALKEEGPIDSWGREPRSISERGDDRVVPFLQIKNLNFVWLICTRHSPF